MTLVLINNNFSALNNNLNLIRQSTIYESVTHELYAENQLMYVSNEASSIIDLWENGIKKYNHVHVVITGRGQIGVMLATPSIIFQEGNENDPSLFYSDGSEINLIQSEGIFSFYYTSRNIASRYCRIYTKNSIAAYGISLVKSTL